MTTHTEPATKSSRMESALMSRPHHHDLLVAKAPLQHARRHISQQRAKALASQHQADEQVADIEVGGVERQDRHQDALPPPVTISAGR